VSATPSPGPPAAAGSHPVPDAPPALVMVAHGSRSAASEEEMEALRAEVAAALPGVDVRLGYLEMSLPSAGTVIDGLAGAGCRRAVVLPVILLAGGHGKSDVPAVVLAAQARHPQLELSLGNPLGISSDLVAILGARVLDAGAGGLPLLLIGRGTSDPDANGDAHKVARLVAEWTGASFVHTAFTGVTTPMVAEGLDVFARLGHDRLAVAFWFLADGLLVQRARSDIAEFRRRRGVEVVDVGYLGPDVRVAQRVVQRYREAIEGTTSVNCDTCAYRAPWPGIEERAGAAIGVGHSALAAAHRHATVHPDGGAGGGSQASHHAGDHDHADHDRTEGADHGHADYDGAERRQW